MRAALILALALVVPQPGHAGPASERLFATHVMDTTAADTALIYAHDRTGLAHDGLQPIDGGMMRVNVSAGDQGARQTRLEMGTGDQMRVIGTYPAANGNPVLPIFLESALRAMSRITGGSPFYIRNRIKEALGSADQVTPGTESWNGTDITTDEIVIRPFANDAKRARMGAFADMEFRFVMSDEAPGGYILLSARSAADASGTYVYQETIELTGTE
jgi:hypothetical protein